METIEEIIKQYLISNLEINIVVNDRTNDFHSIEVSLLINGTPFSTHKEFI